MCLRDPSRVGYVFQVARRLKKTQVKELMQCATLMKHGGQFAHAFETYTKLGDFRCVSRTLNSHRLCSTSALCNQIRRNLMLAYMNCSQLVNIWVRVYFSKLLHLMYQSPKLQQRWEDLLVRLIWDICYAVGI